MPVRWGIINKVGNMNEVKMIKVRSKSKQRENAEREQGRKAAKEEGRRSRELGFVFCLLLMRHI